MYELEEHVAGPKTDGSSDDTSGRDMDHLLIRLAAFSTTLTVGQLSEGTSALPSLAAESGRSVRGHEVARPEAYVVYQVESGLDEDEVDVAVAAFLSMLRRDAAGFAALVDRAEVVRVEVVVSLPADLSWVAVLPPSLVRTVADLGVELHVVTTT